MTFAPLLVAAVLASNADGKQMVRQQQGRLVPIAKTARPLIPTSISGQVAHLWVKGGQVKDSAGATWTETGVVPRVAKAPPRPEGLGPFSTTNFLAAPTAGVLDVSNTSSFTVVALVKVGASPTATENLIHNKLSTSTTSAGVSMELNNTGTRILCRAADGTTSVGPTSANGSLAPGGLYDVACVFTRSGGNLTAQAHVNGAVSGTPSTLAIGSATGGANIDVGVTVQSLNPVTGTIYEVAIWKRALSDAEVTSIHSSLTAAGLF